MNKIVNILPLLTLIVGVSLSFIFFLTLEQYDLRRIQEELEGTAVVYTDALDENFQLAHMITRSIKRLYDSSDFVDHDEFIMMAQSLLSEHREINVLGWAPKVTNENREEFLSLAREIGVENFQIKKISPSSGLQPSEFREISFPILYYLSRFKEQSLNAPVVGFDVFSNELRREIIKNAFQKGLKTMATPIVKLADDGSDGILMFAP
ncbi:MAG: CHASE domain-containing protein, partial [Pseudomonadota bacterium]